VAIRRAISHFVLGSILLLAACERAPRERRLPVPDLRGGGVVIELDADAPIDPRVIPLAPEDVVGTHRICDLAFVGEPAVSTGAYPLPPGIGERRVVRCFAATGEGDVDLHVPETFDGSAAPLAAKRRIKVRVRSADGGLEGAPLVELVGVLGESPLEPPPPSELAVMAARDRFGDRDLLPPGQTGRCAIAWAGRFTPIPEAERARRPPGARHRARLACRHNLGEDEVELVFSDRRASAALGLRRGRIVELRVLSREGPAGSLPITVFALRDPNE
jgi:hypothetical protein